MVPLQTRELALRLMGENTSIRSAPLCPELRLHLLRDDAPVWHASEKHLFDDAGLRPYWAFCWGSGQALARYVLDHPELVSGRRVLDFGAGCGIAGIAAAKAGAAHVTATEIDPLAVVAIEMNARLNDAAVEPSVEDVVQTGRSDWQVLLAADVCYWISNAQWLQRFAEAPEKVTGTFCAKPGTSRRLVAGLSRKRCLSPFPGDGLMLIGDPGRPGLNKGNLQELARYRVRTVPEIERHSIKEAAVYCFRR